MAEMILNIGSKISIQKTELDSLIKALRETGYETIGPVMQNQVISCAPIEKLDDLPQGYSSEGERGYFRLQQNNHNRYFDATPGSDSWKKFLFPPRTTLFYAARENGSWKEFINQEEDKKYAFIGVRPCDLAAINIQDKVFIREDYVDPIYSTRRANALILVVNCLYPSSTCFCTSMGTGPQATTGFDLSLTELEDVFLVEIGSDAGILLVQNIEWRPASANYLQIASQKMEKSAQKITRKIEEPQSVPALLLSNLAHPNWDEVGGRCLSCTNCTLVCPTCFCWEVEDSTNLAGNHTQRTRVWDSCFNLSYAAQAGGNIRPTTKSRYRQWLTHKMGTWVEQFGESGCVGCGRCIVWCPAKIDITEEVNSLREATS
ncbi:MAG: 4Fe-4S dicluster domain-containing protein [Chloroflexota bacterium]|nr:MAG: 4Fe-4S dicluster domain-containing protein [Chloroflexota bacterium]